MSILSKLFSRAPKQAPVAVQLPPPQPLEVVRVVGDIHGRADLLDRLLSSIEQDGHLVFVGDYIDRGDESKTVLERLMQLQRQAPDHVTCLMGNHERMMLEFLDFPVEKGSRWLRNGGLQTLASFSIGGVSEASSSEALETASSRLRAAISEDLELWLRALPLKWQSGNLWVTHAAADPDIPMEAQDPKVLQWGHREFLQKHRNDGVWVAHGHTVVAEPEFQKSRISVDTGAYYTGRLTCATITPDQDVSFVRA